MLSPVSHLGGEECKEGASVSLLAISLVPPTVGTLTESLSRQDCPAEVAADLLADGHTTSKAAIKACKCSSERRSATTGLLRAISIGMSQTITG